ncbi:serine/threonine protein kinase [Streptomyces sp. RKND-216]|uniref:protein kinase domain-containing protein n=1 Tax=Streptomyces sp. RKND-216 TaxID=2562581 RepID=UPI00109D8F40|nr:protein kinase [Streptomyces sp. RKND-216]THA25405.1 serine/threonine protein kinase [Streptomyces sp. RKND-216]
MADSQAAGGPSEPEATGGSVPESPDGWGNNGLVGDGRYRLTHRLGRGGMAEVYAAEDVRLGRTVAVKLLRSDLAEDPVSKARFTREAQSVAGLNHHAVVAVYDSGEEIVNGSVVPYIVMELVEGRTIRDLLHGPEAPPADQALIIVSGVLEALAYSHQHGIVHRDIKPANVIITHTGAVKVMDFGIARALHGASNTMTQTGMVMGTPQYLSPEQALGKTVDTRSDLYATGCLLYELLTLRPPFTGETPLSVVYQHVQDEPVLPSRVSDAVPPELDGLVMRSLAKDPDDRFQTAEEMRGLVQYGLRMLQEQGGHTGGLWNTGAVVAGGTTPPMGTPGVGTMGDTGTGGFRGAGDTQTRMGPPLLMGPPDRGDGGFEGGHRDDGRGGGGAKYALIAFLAVLAIAAGIFFALNAGDDGGETDPNPGPSSSSPRDDRTSREPTDDGTDTDVPGTTGDTGDDDTFSPSEDPSPTEEPSSEPPTESTEPTSEPPTSTGTTEGSPGGGGEDPTDGGTTDGGTTEGETSGGEEGGTSLGSEAGGGDGSAGASTGADSAGGLGAAR